MNTNKPLIEKAPEIVAALRCCGNRDTKQIDCERCPLRGPMCVKRMLEGAADLIEQLTAKPPNEPLTLEELRGMDTGEWLWIECLEKFEYHGKVSAYYRKQNDYTQGEALCCGYPGISFGFDFSDYGTRWLAYRRKPEGSVE